MMCVCMYIYIYCETSILAPGAEKTNERCILPQHNALPPMQADGSIRDTPGVHAREAVFTTTVWGSGFGALGFQKKRAKCFYEQPKAWVANHNGLDGKTIEGLMKNS